MIDLLNKNRRVLLVTDDKEKIKDLSSRVKSLCGHNGQPFKIYKFRSMVANAEEMLTRLMDFDKLEEPVFKLKDDPRVTFIGKILRKTSIDELPQLFNVLKGDLRLV